MRRASGEAAERALREDLGFATAQMEAIISAAERRVVTEALLPLLGPIAPVLVARYAEKAVGADDFYRRLADTISSEKDRASFSRSVLNSTAMANSDRPDGMSNGRFNLQT